MQRECIDTRCGWTGPESECRTLRGPDSPVILLPLCPECGEVTEPTVSDGVLESYQEIFYPCAP